MPEAGLITAEEAALDHRPQYTPGFTRLGRRYVARQHARRNGRTIRAHLASTSGLPTGAVLVAEADRQLGKGYSASISCRCSDACTKQDCSGFVSGARNAVTAPYGFGPICMSSFGFGPMCKAAGRLIPEAQAIWTPGAIGIENAWGSSNGPLGTNGHIVIFTGDGKTTIEEMGTRYGCVHGPATGRGFNAWALLPDIDYTPPVVWKVKPVYDPALQVRDVLNDPGKGAWVGMSDGTVIYSGPNNEKVQGGMTATAADRKDWNNRTLAQLRPIKRHNGDNGYQIVATDGHTYVPRGEA